MKKLIFSIALLSVIVVTRTSAQTSQGRMLVGASSALSLLGTGSELMTIGYTTTKYKSDANGYEEPEADKTISFNLLPRVGYFVADNFAIGLDLNMALSSQKDGESDDQYKQSLLSAGPFVRYYIPTSRVLPFLEVGGTLGQLTYKYEPGDNIWDDESESKLNIFTIGGGAGAAFLMGERVTFDALLGYYSLTYKDADDNDDNNRIVMGTLGLRLGITVLLGSK